MTLTHPSRLSLSLLLSLTAHGAAALWLVDALVVSKQAPAPVLSVELSVAQAPSKSRTRPSRPEPQVEPAPTSPARSIRDERTASGSNVETAPQSPSKEHASAKAEPFEAPFLGGSPQHAPAASAQAHSQQKLAELRSDVVNYLNQQFRNRFVYPHRARRRGWQGRVLVHIEVNRDGRLKHIEVSESSGYEVLDQDAVRTFRKIGRLGAELSARLGSDSQFAIPVIYRLTRG